MHNTLLPRFASHWRLLALLVVTVAMAAVGGAVPPAAGDPAPSVGKAAAQGTDGSGARTAATPGTFQVTLLTGDVVTLHVAAGGEQSAWLEQDEPLDGTGRPPQIFERDGHVHVIPAEAAPYLSAGVLDERLFNITRLVEQGYHDAADGELPLVVSAPEGPSTLSVPDGAEVERELSSIDAVSLAADKSQMRAVWESLRGPATLADGADALLAGAGRVWLNGRVQAMLDESVAQIGAPEAWEAGFDGDGVTVAVLDTGYDPHHPDLQETVAGARNFTADEDPAGEVAVDGNGHGTHVAATIAGTGAASDGARKGVAPGADLLIGKVLNNEGEGYEDEIIASMEWAVAEGARVVNMSLGSTDASDGTDPMSVAVDELTEASGALFVVAAGNAGPFETTVGSPGAATAALTVGAVDKNDEAAWFSSRGPRLGDGAIKPEIVAPGVDIVAARAAGTSLGNLLGEHYTSLNGTSMAAPHVAGAAAILAQRHGDWDVDELKSKLISSSIPLDGEPITFQGAGRLDVAAATSETVTVSDGSLRLGTVQHDGDPVTRTLTYTNPTDRRVTLRLSADVARIGTDGGPKPVLRFSQPTLSIPAGGQAGTEVRLSPKGLAGGGYEGRIVAQDPRDRSVEVRTVTSFEVEGPRHTVTVTAVDRDGAPAWGPVELLNTDVWEGTQGYLVDGIATLEVYEGVYSMMAALETGADLGTSSITVAGEPELVVDEDVTLTYDAREAQAVSIATPKPADADLYHVMWRRAIDGKSVTNLLATGTSDRPLYMLASSPVRTGEFELSTMWQLVQPLLTVQVPGPDGSRVEPSPALASHRLPYVGDASLPLVYAGHGTPEEFAEVDVEGKIALVTRDDRWDLRPQMDAANAAGAELLLIHNDESAPWRTAQESPMPTYLIDLAAGTRLREAVVGDPELTLNLAGVRDSTYTYRLAFTAHGRIPAGKTYEVSHDELATVEGAYREGSDRMNRREYWVPHVDRFGLGGGLLLERNGPVERTDYLGTDGVLWQRLGTPHWSPTSHTASSAVERYEPGQTYHQQWWGPLVRPSVPPVDGLEAAGMPVARFRDAIRAWVPPHRFGDGTMYGGGYTPGVDFELTLRRDGEVVGTSFRSDLPSQFTVPPEDAELELRVQVETDADYWSDTSIASDTTWRFRSERTGEDRTVLPLVQVNYSLDVGLYNEVPVGESYPLVLKPEYQPEATGPGGFTATVEVSFDDGQTWSEAPVESVDGQLHAMVPATREAGFATVRVVVTDADGNALSQRIDRAWRIS